MVLLRDMVISDIENYVRWFTEDTEWNDTWGSPWEKINTTAEYERKSWKEYYEYVSCLSDGKMRFKFEIEVDGKHIGWVSAYDDLDYIENPNKILAIGIEIPDKESRGFGYGTKALTQYIEYLSKFDHKQFFIQTWSGNIPMIKVIEKLGFKEYKRKKNFRVVKNRLLMKLIFFKYLHN